MYFVLSVRLIYITEKYTFRSALWFLLCREALGGVGGRVFGIAAVQQKLTPDQPKIVPRLGETPILTILGNPRPYAILLIR